MLSLFKSNMTYDPVELLDSKLYNEVSFYEVFTNDLEHALRCVVTESPFLAVERTQNLLPLLERLVNYGVKARINTRHPRYHDHELQMQAWQSLNMLIMLSKMNSANKPYQT